MSFFIPAIMRIFPPYSYLDFNTNASFNKQHALWLAEKVRGGIFYAEFLGGNEMLRIENLTKSYGDKVAVDNLSLHIMPGNLWLHWS